MTLVYYSIVGAVILMSFAPLAAFVGRVGRGSQADAGSISASKSWLFIKLVPLTVICLIVLPLSIWGVRSDSPESGAQEAQALFASARADLENYLAEAPRDAAAWKSLADLHYSARDYEQALTYYERARDERARDVRASDERARDVDVPDSGGSQQMSALAKSQADIALQLAIALTSFLSTGSDSGKLVKELAQTEKLVPNHQLVAFLHAMVQVRKGELSEAYRQLSQLNRRADLTESLHDLVLSHLSQLRQAIRETSEF